MAPRMIIYEILATGYRILKRAGVVPSVDMIDISDSYINWLCFANAGILCRGNLYCFDYAIKNLVSNNPIVEIGSFCGLSTNAIVYYLERNGGKNKVITCDKWIFEGADKGGNLGSSNISHGAYREFVRDTYVRNIRMFSNSNLPHTVEAFSDDFFQMWAENREVNDILGRPIKLGGSISFCYIDGNHTYEYVKRDFENVHRYLEPGGFVLFDDSADGAVFGSATLMKEVMKHKSYELIMKNPNYLFRRIE